MIETKNILNEINKEGNNPKELFLKVKDSETGEVNGVLYNYVADEILFLFISENEENRTCADYIRNLEGESQDNCWDSYISIPEGYVHPWDEHDCGEDEEILSPEELAKCKLEVVVNLNTEIYFGDESECPLKDGRHREIKFIERIDNSIVLVY